MSSCVVFRTELAVFDDGGKTPAESCLKSSERHSPAPCPSLPLSHPSASLRTCLTGLGTATFHPRGPGVPGVTAKADFQLTESQSKSEQAGLGLSTKPGNGISMAP